MRISTIEIKMLIKKCVSRGGIYTIADLNDYISRESNKSFTRGQISGAISQLIDLNEISRIDRGLYTGKETSENAGYRKSKNESDNLKKDQQFRNGVKECLNQVEKMLENLLNEQKVWELSNEQFETLSKLRSLKTTIEKIRIGCE